jgi:zinc transport system substrate-binding protein
VIAELDARVVTAQQLPGIQLGTVEGAADPHLWLDSTNARLVAAALATALQQLDPANAERYRVNTERFAAALVALDMELAQTLQPLRAKPWAVSHDAFRYFTQQHGLQQPLTLTDSSNNAPGVRSVVAMREQLVAQQIRCLLTEPTENHQQLDSLLSGSDITIVSADVLGVSIEPTVDAYPQLLRQLAVALQLCMGERDE